MKLIFGMVYHNISQIFAISKLLKYYEADIESPIIPYKYFVEMVCDSLAAGLTYQGKNWTDDYQLSYWLRTREKARIHPKMDKLLTKVYSDIAKKGLKPVINKAYLKELYNRYTR